MPLSRRRFLALSGSSLFAFTATGCTPLATEVDFQSPVSEFTGSMSGVLQNKAESALYKQRFLGYPVNMNTPPDDFFSWRDQLAKAGIDQFAYNNVGNPFKPSPIPFNTHELEREVILRFADLYGFDADNHWGFLSHSGTDSNMHGMYMGRTLLKGRTGKAPRIYFTEQAHYSIQILRDLLGMEGVVIRALEDGSMDIDDLARQLAQYPNDPALVVATLGTTFKGAIDPLDRIQQLLQGKNSYVHLDAALFGGYFPYIRESREVLHQTEMNSASSRYDSIAVSCHKFFGFPSPAGLFVTRETTYQEFNTLFSSIHNPEYIHHVPGTITCSRDAVKPAEFYYFSLPESIERQAEDARHILKMTNLLMEQMMTRLLKWQPARFSSASNTIYFLCPPEEIIQKYSLATMELPTAQGIKSFAHVVIMPHVTEQVIDEFLFDLESAG